MKKFSKSSSFRKSDSGRSEGKSFSKPRGESRFGAGRRDAISSRSSMSRGTGESFEAKCDSCGKMTDLPFKPTGAKPVYCRSCFNSGNNESSGRSFERNDRDRAPSRDSFEPRRNDSPRNDTSDAIAKINAKIDKIMKALKIEDK